jgi:hypothetical protein
MSNRESNSSESNSGYMRKKVMVNGQPVTLYSKNGQTWLSSPEEIEDVMARLDNTRSLLGDLKAEAAGKDAAADKKDKSDKSDKGGKGQGTEDTSAAMASKNSTTVVGRYRMKGPKPRPILRQDGVAITGTPVAPISASQVQMKVGDDQPATAAKSEVSGKKAAPAKRASVKGQTSSEAVSKLAKALSKVVPQAKKGSAKGSPVERAKPGKTAKEIPAVKAKLGKVAKKAPPAKTAAQPKAKSAGKVAVTAKGKKSKKSR